MADESSEAMGKIDMGAVDDLQDLRERQRVLEERLEKIEEKKDNVSPQVYARVRDDYQSQYRTLREEAVPLEKAARNEARRLGALLDTQQGLVDQVRLDEEEVVLRHVLGELDDATFEQTSEQLHQLLAGHQRELESAKALRERFREVLPEGEREDGTWVIDGPSSDDSASGDAASGDAASGEAWNEPVANEPDEPVTAEPATAEPVGADAIDDEVADEAPLDDEPASSEATPSAETMESASFATSPNLAGEQVAALADAGPGGSDAAEEDKPAAAPNVRLGALTEPMPLVFATEDGEAAEDLDDEEVTGEMQGDLPAAEALDATPLDEAAPAFEGTPLSLEPGEPPPFAPSPLDAPPLEAAPLDAPEEASEPAAPPVDPPSFQPPAFGTPTPPDAAGANPFAATPPEMPTRRMSAEELAAEASPTPSPGDGATRIAPVASLVYRSELGEEQRFPLRFEPMTIGRTQDNDICVPGLTVSRRHAQVEMGENGFRVLDLGSENGIFVNGRQVKNHDLAPGDRLELGSAEKTLVFEIG